MKVLSIVSNCLAHTKILKMSKIPEEFSGASSNRINYKNSHIFHLERGVLSDSEISAANELKKTIFSSLKLISSPDKLVKDKLSVSEKFIKAPKNIIALKVDNPRITAFSGQIKRIRNDEYLDFIIHGYFGDKKRFLINNEGEIVKTLSPDFFKKSPVSYSYETETVYYTQSEINNLNLRRYIDMFQAGLSKLNEYLLSKEPVNLSPPPKLVNWSSFTLEQIKSVNSIQTNFNNLYNGIMNNSRTPARRKALSNICGVKIHKKFPLMLIDNINAQKQNISINFTKIGKKSVLRVTIFDKDEKFNRLFIDGRLAEETFRRSSNPFTVGRIARYYTPNEAEELGVLQLLDDINKKLLYGQKQLRELLG